MEEVFASYDWEQKRERERRFQEVPADARDPRSEFERDRARIVHSVAFRRLQGKTQIFAPGRAEYLRTRVTHSIEVAQIGRSLALGWQLPCSLVEAACMAHDLGHPPFGHTGEAALDALMQDWGGFEGNAQTFRILTRLEEKSKAFPGLNLCRATLLGVLKYPFRRTAGAKKFLYDDDAADYGDWLFAETSYDLVDPGASAAQTIICQVMDWSDDVAYSIHDMEDGLLGGFLLPSLPMERIVEWVWRRICLHYATVPAGLNYDRVREILAELGDRITYRQSTIREVARHYINRFVLAARILANGSGETSFDYQLQLPEEIRQECIVFKMLTLEFIILDERTTTLSYKGREIITRLFECFMENTQPSAGYLQLEIFPRAIRSRLEKSLEAEYPRIICDFLAGMTDGQAIRLYSRLFESTGSSPFEPI